MHQLTIYSCVTAPISSQVGNKIHEGKNWASIAQLGECSPSVTVTCVDMQATLELRRSS